MLHSSWWDKTARRPRILVFALCALLIACGLGVIGWRVQAGGHTPGLIEQVNRWWAAARAVAGMKAVVAPRSASSGASVKSSSASMMATITVNDDSGGTGGSGCKLRDAIRAAETDTPQGGCPAGSGADTIVIPAGMRIELTGRDNAIYGFNGLPVISTNITILGSCGFATITRRSSAESFRFFYVAPTGNLTLQGVVLSGGLARGGNGGSGPRDDGGGGGGGAGLGGAIFNRGTLTVIKGTLSDNVARGGDGGRGGQSNPNDTAGGGGGGGGLGGNGGNGNQSSTASDDGPDGGGGGGGSGGNGGATTNDGDSDAGGGGGGNAIGGNGGNGSGNTGGAGGNANGGKGGNTGVKGDDGGDGGGGGGGGEERNGGNGGYGGGGGGGGEDAPGQADTRGNGGNGGFGGGGGGGGESGRGGVGNFGGGGGGGGAGDRNKAADESTGGISLFKGGKGGDANGHFNGGGGGGGGAGIGGAIFNTFGAVTLINTTFSGNSVEGGIGGQQGGGSNQDGQRGQEIGPDTYSDGGSITTISDTTPPLPNCPPIEVNTSPGRCDAQVFYNVTAIETQTPPATVVCNPPSGSIFPLGPTPVNCTATDMACNMSSCSFTVTVKDKEPPPLSPCPPVTANADPGQCSAIVNYPKPTATDNCGVKSVDCVPAPGSSFPIGTTTVTCKATDISDNMSTCTFPVTVTSSSANGTVTAPVSTTVDFSASDQGVPLRATVINNAGGLLNDGAVTFRIKNGATLIGAPVTVPVSNGIASATYTLPGGTAVGSYIIEATFSPNSGGCFNASVGAATLTVVCSSVEVYRHNFEGAVGSEWSNTSTAVTPAGGRRFLGEFSSQTVSLTRNNLPQHNQVTVAFDLYIFRSWDGNGDFCCGPDIFQLSVAGGPTLVRATFGVPTQSFPANYPGASNPPFSGAAEINTLGYPIGFGGSAVYRVTRTFAHSGSALQLDFAGIGLQGASDEGWGLDNISIRIADSRAVVSVPNVATGFSASNQSIALHATVISGTGGPINGGTVTFQVRNGATPIGSPVSAPVNNGMADANYTLPGGTAGTYTIEAAFTPSAGSCFAASSASPPGRLDVIECLREIYRSDFEGTVGAEWSNTTTSVTPAGGRRFLGEFVNQTASLTLNNLPAHTKATVSFDLFILKSWDGSGNWCCGPDIFDLSVAGGPNLLRATLSNSGSGGNFQTYPGNYPGTDIPGRSGAFEVDTLGYGGDTVYRLTHTFSHTGGSLKLDFSGTGLQSLEDESWGLDNVVVRVDQVITINTQSPLPDGIVGAPYSLALTQTGGIAPVTWSVEPGIPPQLPPGLTLDQASGVISGAPTTTGMFNFMVRATGANGCTATKPLSININKANTTTRIISDNPDPSVFGESIRVNYTVTPNPLGGVSPTGNVTVSDGVNSCTGTVGAGFCMLTLTTVGNRALTATYEGDSNFNGSASSPEPHTVNKADTITTITSDTPDPTVTGQNFVVSFTVTPKPPGSGAPTGNVTVSDGINSCTGTVATGSCVITLTTVGSRALTATYAGDARFNPSASPNEPHTVNKADTTTTITADTPDPTVVGQSFTVNYTVTVNPPGGGAPAGNVTVTDGVNSCTGTVAAGQCALTLFTVGSRTLIATYAGDSNFNGSASAGAGHQVNKADTTTVIISDNPDPSVVGQNVTVSFTVTANAPGSGAPTGDVTVSDGVNSCTGTVVAGSCTLALTTVGNRTLIATYAGDSKYNGSVSANEPHTVNKADTVTTITSDNPDSSAVGQSVTVNFTVVAAAPGSGTPTGNVTVSDGVNSCAGALMSGSGSCALALTTAGARTLTASYAGDANFNPSSDTEPHTVVAPPQIAKSFTPDLILLGGVTTLKLSITNPAANTVALTGVGVIDNLPAGLAVDAAPGPINSCSTGVFNPIAGATSVSVSGAAIPVNTTCDFSVRIKATTAGLKVNTTGNVTSSNGGAGGSASAALTVNTPPAADCETISVTQGSPAANLHIATVNDADQPEENLTVMVTPLGGSGVTIGSPSVDSSGKVTASVQASCAATNSTFTVKVTDVYGAMATCTLTVNVVTNPQPTLSYNDASVAFNGATAVNPATGPSDNGSLDPIVVHSKGTYTGDISVHPATGVVSISNAAPVGKHKITIRATDNCGATTDATFDLTVIGPILSVSKSNPSPPLVVGGNSTYTITVTNNGNGAATTATVKDAIPPDVALISAGGAGWTCSPSSGAPPAGTITCAFSGTIAASGGANAALSVVVRPYASLAGASVTNRVSVDPAGGGAAPNPNICTAADTPSAGCGAPVTSMVGCPTSLTVNDLGDAADANTGDGVCETAPGNGVCTLRAAILEANALAACSPLTINFSVTGVINLASFLPSLNHPNLTINGPGAKQLTVRRNAVAAFRIFEVNTGKAVVINKLTISNGSASNGGGIDNSGDLTINGCAITGNTASNNGGGLHNSGGSLIVNNSTISGNNAVNGGGLGNDNGTAVVTNTTISGNTASSRGGGLANFGTSGVATLTLLNSTVAFNTSNLAGEGGGLHNLSQGGSGSNATTNLKNTIFANNTGENFFNNSTLASQGANLSSDASASRALNQPGDQNNVNPKLAPLGDYGGATQTHALQCGSPAIDAGASSGAPANDQRGLARNIDGNGDNVDAVDIGAFEAQKYVVTTTANSGSGSLRQAILDNNAAGGGLIAFDLAGGGVRTITPNSQLPQISKPVNIDGYTQPGATRNTLAVGGNATLLVEIEGTNAGANGNGLVLGCGDSCVRGLVINRFNAAAINLNGAVAARNWINGNYLGVSADGASALANHRGVWIAGGVSNIIGTNSDGVSDFAERNVISGNTIANGAGVNLQLGASSNVIAGNYIGVDAAGASALPNRFGLILIESSNNNHIGGSGAAARNVISGNQGVGIRLDTANNTVIQGNYIGVAADGATPLGNQAGSGGPLTPGDGITIQASSGATVGGLTPDDRNIIAFNAANGVSLLDNSLNNRILGNAIFANRALGIDLGANSVTSNDSNDSDSGQNNLQNFPVLISATSTVISGSLDSAVANSAYPVRIEFFANAACDASGNGEGEVYLGFTSLAAPGSFSFPFTPVAGKPFITATATDNNGNTSEFSACGAINDPPMITAGGVFTRQQGSAAGAAVQIAAVSDAQTPAGSLTVTATSVPAGIIVGPITNTNGVVTATLAAGCNAIVGDNTVTLTVSDGSLTASATFTVTVVANTPPTIGNFPNATVAPGGSVMVTPDAGTDDNGFVQNVSATASPNTFTGTILPSSGSGKVTINNAGPAGIYTITITVLDNCGVTTQKTFTLTVNTAPVINPIPASRQQGSPVINSTIANVSDADGGSLTVTVNGSTSATVNGVTVSNIVVGGTGAVTADVVADCAATNASFTLTVTDNKGATDNKALNVAVTPNTPPTLTYPASVTVNVGASTTVIPPTGPSDNGRVESVVVQNQGGFTGTASVNSSGVVSLSNSGAAGGTYTITIRATDNCGATTDAPFQVHVNAPPTIAAVANSRQQGSAASNSAIANVSDVDQPGGLNTLVLTVNGGPTATVNGVTVSGIAVSNAGVVTADVVASCTASDATFTLAVTDSGGLTNNATLSVTTTPNSPPSVGDYANTSVGVGGSVDVTPDAGTADNGFVQNIAASASAGFTGTITPFSGSGKVSISNAAPAGVYTITVTVTDNCNATTVKTFTLTVNNPPMITPVAVTRTAGSPSSNSTIANVSDTDQPLNTLTVKVNGGASATVNGVTVSNINISAGGVVTADVIASCVATDASFTLSVTDNVGASAAGPLNVTVNPNPAPTVGNYPDKFVATGGSVTSPPSAAPADNGSIASVTAAASPATFTGTFVTNLATGDVAIINAGPVGVYTITVTVTDNCGATTTRTFTLSVSTPPTINAVAAARTQGSPSSNSTIANVSDPDQALNTLVVTVNNGASATVNGVTVSNIAVNAGGVVTADVGASCAAATANFTLTVTDNIGATATAALTVTVNANTAPTAGNYANTTVVPGGNVTVTPSAAPADNGSIASVTAAASPNTFTGSFSGDTSTGALTITSANPPGVYTITVTVTDNCGAATTKTFTLTVNTAPTISAVAITRQQGSPSSNSTIANVNDAEDAENTLIVKVNGSTSATANGVTVSNITVSAAGVVKADVVADCTATNASFTLSVTDSIGATTAATLNVTVNDNSAPTLAYADQNVAAGGSTTVNPTTATDNGNITGYAIVSVTPALTTAPTINSSGVVSVTNATPGGAHTIIVRATDNCGATTDASFKLQVDCPAISINQTSLPGGVGGTPYNQTLSASPSGPSYGFSAPAGSLPPGLTLSSDGAITGAPEQGGSFTFTVTATAFGNCSGSRQLTIAVTCPTTITVNPPTLHDGMVGVPYNANLTAVPGGGGATCDFQVVAGAMPPGLLLNAETGKISGSPTTSGDFNFTIRATCFGKCAGARDYKVTIKPGNSCPTINLPALPASGGVRRAYSGSLAGVTPSGTYNFTVTVGSLPPGVTLNNILKVVSGTPTAAGTYNFTIEAKRADGCAGSRAYTVVISNGAAAMAAGKATKNDFDGDGVSDLASWEPKTGRWTIRRSSDHALDEQQLGEPGDVVASADYDGDRRFDLAVWRPADGTWLVRLSASGELLEGQFGAKGDTPVPADYDGDGQADLALWRAAEGAWLIYFSSEDAERIIVFGKRDHTPAPADYDGDGKTDLALFSPASGHWLIRLSANGEEQEAQWGALGDAPAPADYDGDGRDDLAVWRGWTGEWFIRGSEGRRELRTVWGALIFGDAPAPGDYDGDGKADVAVWRAAEGRWLIAASLTPSSSPRQR